MGSIQRIETIIKNKKKVVVKTYIDEFGSSDYEILFELPEKMKHVNVYTKYEAENVVLDILAKDFIRSPLHCLKEVMRLMDMINPLQDFKNVIRKLIKKVENDGSNN